MFQSRPWLFAGIVLALLPILASRLSAHAADASSPRMLLVVSGEGRDAGKSRPGFEMDEFAQAWLILRQNGFAIDVASPAGGKVEADRFNPEEPFNAAVLADPAATAALADTLPTQRIDPSRYAGVFVVGGKGAMFDLPVDAALQQAIAGIWDRGGIVAAVCHGPAAFAHVRLADGRPLVQGRAMTGFSEEEEALFGKRWAKEFAFQLEPAMRERGARWQEAALMMPKVVVDGRLLTGQNPYSTAALADAVVRASGRTPLARTPWRDERSMALVEDHLRDPAGDARTRLAADTAGHHVELIGILGYYQLQAASSPQQIADALSIMQLARPHMDEPRIDVAMAEAQWKLGRNEEARMQVKQVLAAHPQLEDAVKLLARMQP